MTRFPMSQDTEWDEHYTFHKIPNPNCHYCMQNADTDEELIEEDYEE